MDYVCIKCGSLVFYSEKHDSLCCSLAVKSKGRLCSVSGWSYCDEEIKQIAMKQGIFNK